MKPTDIYSFFYKNVVIVFEKGANKIKYVSIFIKN